MEKIDIFEKRNSGKNFLGKNEESSKKKISSRTNSKKLFDYPKVYF